MDLYRIFILASQQLPDLILLLFDPRTKDVLAAAVTSIPTLAAAPVTALFHDATEDIVERHDSATDIQDSVSIGCAHQPTQSLVLAHCSPARSNSVFHNAHLADHLPEYDIDMLTQLATFDTNTASCNQPKFDWDFTDPSCKLSVAPPEEKWVISDTAFLHALALIKARQSLVSMPRLTQTSLSKRFCGAGTQSRQASEITPCLGGTATSRRARLWQLDMQRTKGRHDVSLPTPDAGKQVCQRSSSGLCID